LSIRLSGKIASSGRDKTILSVIVLLSLVLAVIFAWRVPFDGSNPDETSHLSYVRLLFENRGLVKFTAGDPAYFETHQPPLYYLFCLIPYALTGGNVFAVRLVAILFQIGTILLAYRAGRDLFPSRPEVGIGAAAFVAFLPTQVQLAGAINNDGLTTLLCTAIFWRLGLLVKGEATDNRSAVILGVLLALCLYTKLTVIQLIPAMAVAVFLLLRSGKTTLPQAIRYFALALTVGVVLASPWLIRNTLLYGDPLNIKIFPLTAGEHTPTPQSMLSNPRLGWTWPDYIRNDSIRTYASFWFIIPPMILLPLFGPQLISFLTVPLLGLGGLVGAIRSESRGGVKDSERRIVYLMLLGLFLILPFFVRFNLQFFQAQGRYFLPALLPAALLCVLGWRNVLGEKRGMVGALLPGAVLLLLSLLQITTF
jgi:4-amino-4-deoxy-L-arabinose transferase-like glycosyltransferase